MTPCENCKQPAPKLMRVVGGPHPVNVGGCCLWMYVDPPDPADVLPQILGIVNSPEDPLTRVLKIRDLARGYDKQKDTPPHGK